MTISTTEKEKIILENLFKVFSEQKNKRDFYIDLEKYIHHIKNSKQLSSIVKSLEEEIRNNLKRIQPENKLKELIKNGSSKQSIKNNKIDVTDINNRLTKEFEEERNKSIWGAWERLLWVYFAFSKKFPDYEFPKNKKLKVEENEKSIRTNKYLHFCFELEEIVGYKIVNDEQRTPNLLNIINEYGNKRDDPNEIGFFRNYAKRIHTYILNELEKEEKYIGNKLPIYINNYLISLTSDGKKPTYQIVSLIRRNIIDYLLKDENRRVLREELAIYAMENKNPSLSQREQISRDIRDINDRFIKTFGFQKIEDYRFISKSDKQGYKINNKKFKIFKNNKK